MKVMKTFCLLSLVFTGIIVYAANPGAVVINEITWMGTDASSFDEWVELLNNTNTSIDLSGWSLSASDGAPSISLTGTISANGYFLLERTDDTSVNDIAADYIYTGALEDGDEMLQLKDDLSQVIDEVDCSSGWFAGDNDTKSTMERLNPKYNGSASENWGTNDGSTINGSDANSNPLNGTPKAQNSVYDISLSVEMSSFSAVQSASGVMLHWTTESEIDIQGFYLSRANEDGGPYIDLNTAIIPCKGEGSSRQVYEFTDNTLPGEGTYTYRLEEIDLKGRRHFLAMKSVQVSDSESESMGFYFIRNYPNPFNPSTTIEFHVGSQIEGKQTSLIVYDLLGRPVKKLNKGAYRSGFFQTQWDGKNEQGVEVPSGLYLAVLKVNGQLHGSKRLIKMQ
ncbi:lamin tail domain-containing protein [candidate division KSB1 bacterium]|nr:lamin tail domain-containing protein [candidate division KSB1 bacterium]